MGWLKKFAEAAEKTDRIKGNPEHLHLLCAGIYGETGSLLAELKKEKREREAYPAYRHRTEEEVGDLLWYLIRLVQEADATLIAKFQENIEVEKTPSQAERIALALGLGARVGEVLECVRAGKGGKSLAIILEKVWEALISVVGNAEIDLKEAARQNTEKVVSRWPEKRTYAALFDEEFPEEEQLPRTLAVEFRERSIRGKKVVTLRCNDLNFGDRLTDNINDEDGYRYHDIFHFAYAVHLGWSPVTRSLLRCKRKSSPEIDENEDGGRGKVIEEGVSAIIFNRAKKMDFFEGVNHVEFGLLKTVREFVEGFEVERVPLWQWEVAILEGYRVFRELLKNKGGQVQLDLANGLLEFRRAS